MNETDLKFNKLKEYVKSLKNVAVAFSSGVDSTFLMEVCKNELKNNCIAITAKSPVFPNKELSETEEFCKKWNIKQFIIEFDNFSIEGFSSNPIDRCYVCKLELFKKIIATAKENNIDYVVEGSNVDDLSDYRPGLKAIKELKVLSPLQFAGLNKEEIRILSEKLKLPTHKKPSFACLATRIPYGEKITEKKLTMIQKAENMLFDLGFYQARVRLHNDIARIEILPFEFEKIIKDEMRKKIVTEFKKIGFSYVSLDLAGYRTGSMNEVINI